MATNVSDRPRTEVVQDDIGRLMDFDAGRVKAITVYADTRREGGGPKAFIPIVRDSLDGAAQRFMDSPERTLAFEESRALIDMALEDSSMLVGKGLALFACGPRGFFEAYTVDTPFTNRVVVARRPYVPPLGRLAETFDTHIIAQVHSDRATIYTAFLHRLWECVDIDSDVPGRSSVGGESQARYQRHRDEHVRRHLKAVADEISALVDEEQADRVLLFGSQEAVDRLYDLLPEPVRQRVLAREAMAADAGEPDVRERTKEILHAHRDQQAEATLAELAARLATDERAVAGVDPVLNALWQRAVDSIVVARGLMSPVVQCVACGWMGVDGQPLTCLSCGGDVEIGTLGARVVRSARAQGASVLFIEDEEAMALYGGMAAFMRY